MKNVLITCDSTCDMTNEQYAEFGIVVLPLYVRIGDDEYRDGETIHANELFEKIEQTGIMPKTAAISVDDYQNAWKDAVAAGNEVVHINISSEFSSCHQNARLAAEELGHVYPVDSRSLSSGSGLLAIEAACMAQAGKSAKEIYDVLNEKREKLNVSFVMERMDYMAKGGRCPTVAALAAGLLKLRLMIQVKDGTMGVGKKYRGRMENVLCDYVRERLSEAGETDEARIFITHTGVSEETLEKIKALILEQKHFDRIFVSTAGCTVSSHSGPGTLGILFLGA